MARITPTTIAILSWMMNASPIPSTWTRSFGSGDRRRFRMGVAK